MNTAEQVMDLVADAKAQESCCRFHFSGGYHGLACGGDVSAERGRHSGTCAYHFGGDCTCGTRVEED